jgi:putative ABC transport system permease protein
MTPLHEAQAAGSRSRLLLVLGAALVLLLIAAANVATMYLTQLTTRRQEVAVRLSLGASRARLIRQALVEGSLLGLTGGATGLLVSAAGLSAVRALIPPEMLSRLPGESAAIRIDGPVIAWTVAAAGIVSLACAMVAMAAVAGRGAAAALYRIARGSTEASAHKGVRALTLGTQLALAVALVLTATVLTDNLRRLRSTDLGFQAERVTSLWLTLSASRYPTPRQRADYYDRVLERVGSVPGVERAGGIDLPFNKDWEQVRIRSDQHRATDDEQLPRALARAATPQYFRTMTIALLSGRFLESGDREGRRAVAVVSRTLAARLWPGSDPIGRTLRAEGSGVADPWLTIVGVVDDVLGSPQGPPVPVLYRPVRQAPPPWLYLTVKSASPSIDVTASVKQAVWAEDPNQPIDGPWTVSEWVRDLTGTLRFVARMGIAFGTLALILACTGVYGLTADAVQQATREIGIRQALGAAAGDIVRMFLWRSARTAVPAMLLGAGGAALLIQWLRSEVEGLAMGRAVIVPLVLLCFALVVAAATYWPARRVAAVDPAAAVRG